MGFPSVDIAFTKEPVALIVNPANEMEAYKIAGNEVPGSKKFFIVKKYGVFEIDSSCYSRMGKTPVCLYYSEYPKPFHIKYISTLVRWVRSQGISRLKKKDIRHSELFDRLKVKHPTEDTKGLIKQYEEKELAKIHTEIQKINERVLQENQSRIEKGEPPIAIDPNDYAHYILDALVNQLLLTREDATALKFQLLRNEITIDDFMQKLQDLKVVTITEPIPLNPRQWMDDFPMYKPSEVYSYIKISRGLDKKIEKLGLHQVHNLIPAAWIVMIVIGVTIGIAVLVGSGVFNGIDKFFSSFKL